MKGWQYGMDDFAKYLLSRLGDEGKVCCKLKCSGSKIVVINPESLRDAAGAVVFEATSLCPCLVESYDEVTGELVFANASRARAFMRFYRGDTDEEAKEVMRTYVDKLYAIYDGKSPCYAVVKTPPVVEFYWHGTKPNPSILLSMVRNLPVGMATTEFSFSKEDDSGLLKIRFRSYKWVKIFREILEEGRP